jgi:hypothetical protein
MPYVTVGKENSANIELYYEDHGSGKAILIRGETQMMLKFFTSPR